MDCENLEIGDLMLLIKNFLWRRKFSIKILLVICLAFQQKKYLMSLKHIIIFLKAIYM